MNSDAVPNLIDLWNLSVETWPGDVAIEFGSSRYRYAEVDLWSNYVAHKLRSSDVGIGSKVGLCVNRSAEFIVGALAVIKCGAAYVPIDSEISPQAYQRLTELCPLDVVLVRPASAPAQISDIAQFCEIDHASQSVPPQLLGTPEPNDAAYIIFTSGTTGNPKGVEVTRFAIASLVFQPSYVGNLRRVVAHLANVLFDAATFEIWGPLLNGGTCAIYNDPVITVSKLERFLKRSNVDIVFMTTALFNLVVNERPAVLDEVDEELTGGESHSSKILDRALDVLPSVKISNIYGPTETTTFAAFKPLSELSRPLGVIPIGRPVQRDSLHIILNNHVTEAVDITGEIAISGSGLALGYCGNPALTEKKFRDVLVRGRQTRCYLTGDIGYRNSDGDIVFTGRRDEQVKLNGYRIELNEIKAEIEAIDGVIEVVLLVQSTPASGNYLAAFLRGLVDSSEVPGIVNALKLRLPAYMIPTRITIVDSYPLKHTGKIDRAKLAQMEE